MKKIVTMVMLFAFAMTTASAQETSKLKKKVTKTKTTKVATTTKAGVKPTATTKVVAGVTGAGMVFDTETIDYGTIAKNSDGNRKFEFTNNGTKPLIITNTQGSCGCTVPTSPKEPIAPGARGSIGVKYATDRVGAFTKSVTVTSNAEGMPTKVVTIKGTVIEDPAATPVAPKS